MSLYIQAIPFMLYPLIAANNTGARTILGKLPLRAMKLAEPCGCAENQREDVGDTVQPAHDAGGLANRSLELRQFCHLSRSLGRMSIFLKPWLWRITPCWSRDSACSPAVRYLTLARWIQVHALAARYRSRWLHARKSMINSGWLTL